MRTPGLINAPDHYMDQAKHMRNVKCNVCNKQVFLNPKKVEEGKKRYVHFVKPQEKGGYQW